VRESLEAATHALKIKPGEIMGELLTPTHMIVVAVVAFVLFGGRKLPELGKGFCEGLRGFKDGIKGLTDELDGSKVAPAVVGKAEAAE
jgi:sec-independent protein translocase protein TatA